MVKKLSSTLTSILDNEMVQTSMDRTEDILPVAEELCDSWKLDLYTRSPSPALNANGEFQGTDLDMSTFLYALVDRGAVITLPEYKTMRVAKLRENERRLTADKRTGSLIGLYSNQDVFSFGVLVKDYSIIVKDPQTEREDIGAYRNFTLLDVNGEWHKGWRCIEFHPSSKENDFLSKKKLYTGNQIIFNNFVHPNRWVSFYGAPYFITKVVIARLEEESKAIYQEMKRLQELGIKLAEVSPFYTRNEDKEVGQVKKVSVPAFEVLVDVPAFSGDYAFESKFNKLKSNDKKVEFLNDLIERRNNINNKLLKRLRFTTRSIEYAFYLHGLDESLQEKLPSWIDAKWEKNYIPKGKRTAFNRLSLFQPKVGVQSVALRYRKWEKLETISVN